jgi:putative transposase
MSSKKDKNLTAYRYRLYPNKTQERVLNTMMFHSKRLYNIARIDRIYRYETTEQSTHWKTQSKTWVTEFRKHDDGIALLPYDTASYVLQRLHKAYDAFFRRLKTEGKERAGFPKKMRFCDTLEYKYPSGINFAPVEIDSKTKQIRNVKADVGNWTTLYVMNVGDIRVRYHRAIPSEGRITYASITKDVHGRWYVSLVVDEPFDAHLLPRTGAIVGVDIGIKYAFALSDGAVFEPRKFYEEKLRDLRIINRKLDRQRRANNPDCYDEKGRAIAGKYPINKSNQMLKTIAERKKLFLEVTEKRDHWLHEVTDDLTKTYDFIALEDLSPQFMIKNKHLALAVLDISFSKFRRLLKYKAEKRGTILEFVPAAYTSQTCSVCGHVDPNNRKTQDKFLCVNCGHNENADIQASKNVLHRGLKQFNQRIA